MRTCIRRRFTTGMLWAALLKCLMVATACGQTEIPTIPGEVRDSSGNVMPYQVILPYSYDPQSDYPLVLFLHGSGESGSDNNRQINGNIRGLIAATRSNEFASILVAPQTNIGWSSPTSDSLVHLILDQVAGTYQIDADRRYISGLSMGGFGTWYMAAEQPDFFAAAVPIAGGIQPDRALDLLNVPIWAFHGDADSVVDVSWSRNVVSEMRELGGSPRYTEYRGVAHDSWTQTYADPDREMYRWMFAQTNAVPEPLSGVGTAFMLALASRPRRRRSPIGSRVELLEERVLLASMPHDDTYLVADTRPFAGRLHSELYWSELPIDSSVATSHIYRSALSPGGWDPAESIAVEPGFVLGLTPMANEELVAWTNRESPSLSQWNASTQAVTRTPLPYSGVGIDYDEVRREFLITSSTGLHRLSRDLQGDTLLKANSEALGVATNSTNGSVYWHDPASRTIQRAEANGGGAQSVVTDLPIQYQFDIDSTTGNLYWSDAANSTIWRSDAFGKNPVPIARDVIAYVVQLDEAGEYIYWWNLVGSQMQRTSVTGGAIETIAVTQGFVPAVGLLQVDGGLLANDDVSHDAIPSVELVTPPTHGTLTLNADGTFLYVPHLGYAGNDQFEYALRDSSQVLSPAAQVVMTVFDQRPMAINDYFSIEEDQPLIVAADSGVLVNDRDSLTSDLTATLVQSPQHGELIFGADGSFRYQPNRDYAGIDSFTYRAFDGSSYSFTTTVRLQIVSTPDPPQANPDRYVYLDGDGGIYTGTLRFPLSTGALSEQEPNSTREVAQAIPLEEFTLHASPDIGRENGANSSMLIPHITISGTGDGSFDYYRFDVLRPEILGIFDIDSESRPNNFDSLLQLYDASGRLLAENDDSNLDAGAGGSTTGLDSFLQYTFQQAGSYYIAVASCCASPVVNGAVYRLHVSLEATSESTLANDSDSDGDQLTATLVTPPQLGTIDFRSDGHFSYIPHPNTFGVDTFTYTAFDGTFTSDASTVTIELIDVNQVPVARVDSYQTLEDGQLTLTAGQGLLANDSDGDSAQLTVVLVQTAEHGALTLESDGSLDYRPHPNFYGTDRFVYQATDGIAFSTPTTVTIQVEAVADPLNAHDDHYLLGAGTTLDAGSDEGRTLFWIEVGARSIISATPTNANRRIVEEQVFLPRQLAIDESGAHIYWTDESERALHRANLDGSDEVTLVTSEGRLFGVALALEADTPWLFWSNTSEHAIYRARLDGSEAMPIVVDLAPFKQGVSIEHLAVDPLHAKLYWINQDSGRVERSNFDGSQRETVMSEIASGTGLAIDTLHGHLYVADRTADVIWRSDLLGMNRTAVVSGIGRPTGVDVDPFSNQLYWTNAGQQIQRARLDGKFIETLQSGLRSPAGIVVRRSDALNPLLNDIDPDGRALSATLIAGPQHGVASFDAAGRMSYRPSPRFIGSDTLTYRVVSGDLISPLATITFEVEYRGPIARPDIYTVVEDNILEVDALSGMLQNDSDPVAPFLNVVLKSSPQHGTISWKSDGSFRYAPSPNFHGSDSFVYEATNGDFKSNATFVTLVVEPGEDAVTGVSDEYVVNAGELLDAGSDQHGYLYFTDRTADRVMKVHPDGTGRAPLVETVYPFAADAAFDAVSQRVLWSDIRSRGVEFSLHDATVQGSVVIGNGLSGIAVDSASGDLFALQTHDVAGTRIVRGRFDGSEFQPIVSGDFVSNHVRIDLVARKVYWAESNYDRIRRANLDGSEIETVVRGVDANAFTLDPVTHTLFWYDTVARSVFKLAPGDADPVAIISGLRAVTDLEVDSLARVLYVADRSLDTIQRCQFDGSQLRTIVSGVDPYGIAVEPTEHVGLLDNDIDPDMDRTSLQVELVTAPSGGAVELDPNGSFSYQSLPTFSGVDSFQYRIWRGTHASDLTTAYIRVLPPGIDTREDSYVVEEDERLVVLADNGPLANDLVESGSQIELLNATRHGSIQMDSSGGFTYIPALNYVGFDEFTYRVVTPAGQMSTPTRVGILITARDDTPTGIEDHFTVVANQTLIIGPPETLIWTDPARDRLSQRNVNGTGVTALAELPVESQGRDVVWSARERAYFWLDRGRMTIYRTSPDPADSVASAGEGTLAVVSGLNSPSGLVLDDASGNLFWLDTQRGEILRATTSGIRALSPIIGGLPRPAAIAIDLVHNRLYWADSSNGSVESVRYDGSDRQTLSTQLRIPVDMEIDERGTTLYYTDAGLGQLGRIDLVTHELTVMVASARSPRGIDIDDFRAHVYWASADDHTIYRIDTTGSDLKPIVNNLGAPWGVLIVPTRSVLANDLDPDRIHPATGLLGPVRLRAELVSGPLHGSLTMEDDGTFQYTPQFNFVGVDQFTYRPLSSINGPLTSVYITVNPVAISADINRDGHVDALDFGLLAAEWGSAFDQRSEPRRTDFNRDGKVDASDAEILFANWSSSADSFWTDGVA